MKRWKFLLFIWRCKKNTIASMNIYRWITIFAIYPSQALELYRALKNQESDENQIKRFGFNEFKKAHMKLLSVLESKYAHL